MFKRVEFEHELEIENHVLMVQVEADVEIEVDDDYGADADGNRGTRMVSVQASDIVIKDFRGNNITKKVETKYKELYSGIVEYCEGPGLED